MVCPYVLKAFAEQLNVLKVETYGNTSMEKFTGTTTDISPKIITHGDFKFMSWIQD